MFILTSTTLIFVAAFAYNYQCSRQLISKTSRKAPGTWPTIRSSAWRRSLPGRTHPHLPGLHPGRILPTGEELKEFLRDFLHAVPEVFGATVAFEPYAFDRRTRFFAPYYFKGKDGLRLHRARQRRLRYFLVACT
jgi:sigma-B regulation protein RsbU (phosphoserine phosphatase)